MRKTYECFDYLCEKIECVSVCGYARTIFFLLKIKTNESHQFGVYVSATPKYRNNRGKNRNKNITKEKPLEQ